MLKNSINNEQVFLSDVAKKFQYLLNKKNLVNDEDYYLSVLVNVADNLCNKTPFVYSGGKEVKIEAVDSLFLGNKFEKNGENDKLKNNQNKTKNVSSYGMYNVAGFDKFTNTIYLNKDFLLNNDFSIWGFMQSLYHEYSHFRQKIFYDVLKNNEKDIGNKNRNAYEFYDPNKYTDEKINQEIFASFNEGKLSLEAVYVVMNTLKDRLGDKFNSFQKMSREEQARLCIEIAQSQYCSLITERQAEVKGSECANYMLYLMINDKNIDPEFRQYAKQEKDRFQFYSDPSILGGSSIMENAEKNEYLKEIDKQLASLPLTEIAEIFKSIAETKNKVFGNYFFENSLDKIGDEMADENSLSAKEIFEINDSIEKYLLSMIKTKYKKEDVNALLLSIFVTDNKMDSFNDILKAYGERLDFNKNDLELVKEGVEQALELGNIPLEKFLINYRKNSGLNYGIDCLNLSQADSIFNKLLESGQIIKACLFYKNNFGVNLDGESLTEQEMKNMQAKTIEEQNDYNELYLAQKNKNMLVISAKKLLEGIKNGDEVSLIELGHMNVCLSGIDEDLATEYDQLFEDDSALKQLNFISSDEEEERYLKEIYGEASYSCPQSFYSFSNPRFNSYIKRKKDKIKKLEQNQDKII